MSGATERVTFGTNEEEEEEESLICVMRGAVPSPCWDVIGPTNSVATGPGRVYFSCSLLCFSGRVGSGSDFGMMLTYA